ncbi:MAG: DUF992 domain-containing protein [Gammaproteobacteria bacterium]|nr:DUF992 domain-containing protein [Gammaproteobacteria bacterium]
MNASADVELGILKCRSVPESRINLVIRSTVDIKCVLKYIDGTVERYRGETGIAIGLDLSFKGDEEFAFSVIAASEIKPGEHPLTGKYVGARLSASAGIGLGAAALIGGSNQSFGLTPLALEANRGAGIAGGVGFLYIEPDP